MKLTNTLKCCKLVITFILIFDQVSNAVQIGSNEATEGARNINKDGNSSFCSEGEVILPNLIFTLFNKNNPQEGTILTQETLNQVDPKQFTTIIIHGYNENGKQGWVQVMKDTYLNKSSSNIITVDWGYYAFGPYPEAACLAPQVGVLVGDLIYNLTQIGLDVKKLQLNGFSMGAQISGFTGKRVYNLTQTKISRINGLDAAIREYLGKPISERLDATDADFVQAIHTNNGVLGYSTNYGAIDFHVNFVPSIGCGSSQYGCPLITGVPTPPGYEYCDHIRSVAYFIESINSNNFIGRECSNCSSFGLGWCNNAQVKTVMGENCPRNVTGVRYLNINYDAPFAQG